MTTGEPLDVLIVEDDDDTRANLSDILELDGHRPTAVSTAAEAFAPRDWSAVDVVILDRKLPDATAERLLPKLRRLAPHAYLIVATGYADVQGPIAALQHGAADYLLKPVQPDILRATLSRIAEHRRLEREKQRTETAFRTVIETSPCLIVLLRRDLRIVYFSPYAAELTGFTAQEVAGRDFLAQFYDAAERARFELALQALTRGVPLRNYENQLRCRAGLLRSIIWSGRTLPDYEGEPALLCIGLDITDYKRAEERALQAQRLAAIGETMTGLVHESRNALQRSRACLEMLALEVQDRPDALDLVERTQRAQEHLQHLYEEVRQYAAPLKLSRTSTDLRGLWREVWHDLAVAREGRNLQLAEEIDDVESCCAVDRFALSQVWRNILENAISVSPTGGCITVRCRKVDLEGVPAAEVTFADQGPGLDPEQRRRIFEPFFTTKTKGTGLGMAIAQRIISAHGGRLVVAEPRGAGAEIVVTLPKEPV